MYKHCSDKDVIFDGVDSANPHWRGCSFTVVQKVETHLYDWQLTFFNIMVLHSFSDIHGYIKPLKLISIMT